MEAKIKHDRLKIAPSSGEYFFDVISGEIEHDIDFIVNNKIENIQIYSSDFEKLYSRMGAEGLLFLKKLELGINDNNYFKIESLVNLEYLVMNESAEGLDFSKFTKLKKLFFIYNKNNRGLDGILQIEEISVSKANGMFLNQTMFQSYSKLKKLEIIQSSFPNGLKFIQDCKTLRCLEIYYAKDEINIVDLLPLKNHILELKITRSKRVVGYEILKEFVKMEKLVFSDCNEINNSSFADYLPNLKQLTVVGSSFFVDGKINNLLKNGLTVGIDNKKNYTLKSNQFLNYFREPPVPMI